jgi:hypothetical protein
MAIQNEPPTTIQLTTSCVVKVAVLDRPFCFQLATPTRIFYFSAETHKAMFEWISAIREIVARLLKEKAEKKVTISSGKPDVCRRRHLQLSILLLILPKKS